MFSSGELSGTERFWFRLWANAHPRDGRPDESQGPLNKTVRPAAKVAFRALQGLAPGGGVCHDPPVLGPHRFSCLLLASIGATFGCANGAVGEVIIVEVTDAGDSGPARTNEGGIASADSAPGQPAADANSGGACTDWAGPTVSSRCTDSCSKHTCGANGCYGGWWCQISTGTCQKAPPSGCH